mgnify:CR=1 FL=1|jgi:Mitochondrial sulfhydryl oxidase involved in the biogenesis of cytosolic Fe/S proteins
MENENNGLLPKIWGPDMWNSLHNITFGYPVNPTDDDKKRYRLIFENIGYVLPCCYCADSYNKLITTDNVLKINDNIFENRETLTLWLYNVHEEINKKLGYEYSVSYPEMVKKYESYRAICDKKAKPKCIMSFEDKKISYYNFYKKQCVIIPYKIALCFKSYGLSRNISDFEKLDHYDYVLNKKMDRELYDKRNEECYDIIKYMRLNAIKSIEDEGIYKDMPTIEELKLIARLCSNLNNDDLIMFANKMGYNIRKVYKFG